MTNGDIISGVREYVLELLSDKIPNNICFHTVIHTQEVVKAATKIARECQLAPKQSEIVILAAWFHDCGYTTTYTNHEDSSKTIALDFLNKYDYHKDDIQQVLSCIEATRLPQTPNSLEGEILADADLYHLTKPDYPEYTRRLRIEFKTFLGKKYTNREWDKLNYTFLKSHSYFTVYGRNILQKFKEVNIALLKSRLN